MCLVVFLEINLEECLLVIHVIANQLKLLNGGVIFCLQLLIHFEKIEHYSIIRIY